MNKEMELLVVGNLCSWALSHSPGIFYKHKRSVFVMIQLHSLPQDVNVG
jgi:hypothetical protein